MKSLALVAGLLLAIRVPSPAATIPAASGSQADVQTAINAARAGDTVLVPAGTATWTSGLALNKGIHLRGSGGGGFIGHSRTSLAIGTGTKTFTTQAGLDLQTGQTVRAIYIANGTRLMEGTVTSYRGTTLELNVTAIGGSGTHGSWVFALPARTTIINNAANDWGRAMMDVAEDPAASVEISGIRFQSGTATHGAHLNLTRTAGAKPVVIHDCWFTHGGDIGRAIQVMNNRGLVYRCSFDGGLETGVPVLHHTGIMLKWLGAEASQSWTTPDTMGSRDTTGLNNFYVEDCYFAGAQCFDFDDNSRTVVRRCLFNMIVMSLRRNCRYAGHDYPVPRQVGQGHDGTGPILDPLYIWNNSGNPRVGLNDYEPDEVGQGLHSADYIREGRDYHVGQAKPGYAKYTYPHPLRRELLPRH